MGAPIGSQNALGNSGGKTLQDRQLASKVRKLALIKIKALLEMPEVKMKVDDYELYKAVLIKLAGSVLPRLNEHTGEDGGAIMVTNLSNEDLAKIVGIYEANRTRENGDGERNNEAGH